MCYDKDSYVFKCYGLWEEGRLSDELQAIIAKHWTHIDGRGFIATAADTEIDTADEQKREGFTASTVK